jgi:hypothetical protein
MSIAESFCPKALETFGTWQPFSDYNSYILLHSIKKRIEKHCLAKINRMDYGAT